MRAAIRLARRQMRSSIKPWRCFFKLGAKRDQFLVCAERCGQMDTNRQAAIHRVAEHCPVHETILTMQGIDIDILGKEQLEAVLA